MRAKLLSMQVRGATAEEVRAVQWAVLRPDGPLPSDTEPPADWVHVAALEGGVVVGACSVGPGAWPRPDLADLPTPTWQLRSMAVLPSFRGGTGALLLDGAVRMAVEAGARSMWAGARVRALGLYLHGGWALLGEEWDKPGVGPHRWVTRILSASV